VKVSFDIAIIALKTTHLVKTVGSLPLSGGG
jgi:hypothetical protein